MASDVPGPWIRRPLSIAVLVIGSLLTPLIGPPALLIACIWDLVTRSSGNRRSRIVVLISALFIVNLAGQILVFVAWLISPLGFNVERASSQARYRWIMTWWSSALLATIRRIVPVAFDLSELDEALLEGNAIVVARHRSLLDAVYPAGLFGRLGLTALYTLKEDLRWEPNIDIVGHRMGHVFVTRSPADLESELEPIRALARRIDDNSVAIIFPEGTFFNEQRKSRAIATLEEHDPKHADAARSMRYLLPPRPAGTLALLEGAPESDVIMLGHVGFELFGSIREILANLGANHLVAVRAWRYARSSIPSDPAAQIDWLYERWAEMDQWIDTNHPLRPRRETTMVPAAHGGS